MKNPPRTRRDFKVTEANANIIKNIIHLVDFTRKFLKSQPDFPSAWILKPPPHSVTWEYTPFLTSA